MVSPEISSLRKGIFYFVIILIILYILIVLSIPIFELTIDFWNLVMTSIFIFIFIALHSIINLGVKKAFIFFIISTGISFILEFLSINYGYFFGVYSYSNQLGLKILSMPILVILLWWSIIYVAYAMSANFILSIKTSMTNKFYLSLFISSITALATVAWDLGLDPLAVAKGWWIWGESGIYFNIPISNFVWWFFTAFLVALIFQIFFGYKVYKKEEGYDYTPTLGYFLFLLFIIALSLDTKRYVFILISSIALLPFISAGIIRYFTRKLKISLSSLH